MELASTHEEDRYVVMFGGFHIEIKWNLSVTTTSIIKYITCDLFSNVF